MNALPSSSTVRGKLSETDAAELAAGVAALTKSGLPLPAGLRALAEELPSRRLRGALSEMALRLERGDSIEAVMDSAASSLPPYLYGLLLAGLRSGQLPEVMEEYIQTAESQRKLRQRLRLSLAYPIVLAVLMTLMVVVFNQFFLGSFEKIFKDFGTSLPAVTIAFFASAKYMQWIMGGIVIFLCIIPLLASDAPGFGWLSPLVYRMPLLGSLLKYTRWAMFSKLTAMMLAHRTPLPEALRSISAGLSDPYMSRACRKTAGEVENGCRLSDSMQNNHWFPPSLIPFMLWGEKENALPEAFSSAHELYEGRANSQTTSFMAIMIPIMFLMIMVFAGLTIVALFMPLISLITSLTGGPGRHQAGGDPMNQPIEILFGILILLVVGIVVLIVKTIVFWSRLPLKRRPDEFILTVFCWGLIFLATTAFLFVYLNIVPGLSWLFAIPCIIIFVKFQNLRMKQQGFLWMLALAAEKRIPLVPAIDAYASETGGNFGDLAADFSALLQNGIPLPDALRMTQGLIPADRYPIICSAYESGELAKGLREAAAARNLQQVLWGSLSAKMLYVVAMIMFGSFILTFIMIKIIPAFERIFKDFETKLPWMTLKLVKLSHQALLVWPILALTSLFFLFLFFHSLLKFLGVAVFELPGTRFLMRRKHTADIMDNLAMAVENHRTIDAGLQTLVRCYPNNAIRVRLGQSLADVQAGVSWSESLQDRGLIRPSDLAVLQAAERAGNLSWAMREMADSNRRRLAYRMNVLVQTIFPPVVLCVGGVVMFIVVALFLPLIKLIERLS